MTLSTLCLTILALWCFSGRQALATAPARTLTLSREGNLLILQGPHLPHGQIEINYLEAFCRANSTEADWGTQTVIPHVTKMISLSRDRKTLKLRSILEDGVTVEHTITAKDDEVDFRLVAHNPGRSRSAANWAQVCSRLGDFTGVGQHGSDPDDYLSRCFIFLEGKLQRMPTPQWATRARYTPGQVWCPSHVPRTDVNPRPLNPLVPSNGLIGCYSGDEKLVWATAWEPYQELFQGVIKCLHGDFRLGGLAPGETKHIRGKIYIVDADVNALLRRYAADFPEHVTPARLEMKRLAGGSSDTGSTASENLKPLSLTLPAPGYNGTPQDLPKGPSIEPYSDKPRPAFLVPLGVKNVALHKPAICSDKRPINGTLAQVTDGVKDASDDSVLELHKNVQWLQVDLGADYNLYALLLWHDHRCVQVYRSVVVQTAIDAGFTQNVQTLFNNDAEDATGLGLGQDRQYFETHQGKLIDAKGIKARYLRFYSKGSNASALNCYTEIEAYGLHP